MIDQRGRRNGFKERTTHLENLIALGRAVHGRKLQTIPRGYVLLTGTPTDQLQVIRIDD